MFCHKCGSTIPDTVRFCVNCGAPVRDAQPAPVSNARPVSVPAPVSVPEPPKRDKEKRDSRRPFRLVLILALIAAFGCGVLAGFFIGSSVSEPPVAAAVWEAGPAETGVNSGDHAYAAFDVTAGADADKLYVIIETVQDGSRLLAKKSAEDGRMFTDVEEGDTLRVKLFIDYDKFTVSGEAFTAENGDTYRKGKTVPLAALLESGLEDNTYTFYFYSGSTCVGQVSQNIVFE